jgi:acylphosphatase
VSVSGSVQGVFFRTSCVQLARELGLAGWVRNTPDGMVEAVFEGTPEAVDRMVAWCRIGPPLAAVQGVQASDEEPKGEDAFRITR